jgi:hypothetical protein
MTVRMRNGVVVVALAVLAIIALLLLTQHRAAVAQQNPAAVAPPPAACVCSSFTRISGGNAIQNCTCGSIQCVVTMINDAVSGRDSPTLACVKL